MSEQKEKPIYEMGLSEYMKYSFNKDKKWILLILIFILVVLFITEVKADWLDDGSCQKSTDCILSAQLVNKTTYETISDANCTIDIYNVNSTFLRHGQMINLTGGFYNYTVNMNITGLFPSIMTCNNTFFVDKADLSFVVSDPNFNNYLYFILFIIPIVMFYLSIKEDDRLFMFFAGMIFIFYATAIYMNYFERLESTIVTNALSVVLLGIGLYCLGNASMDYLKELGG